jgi:hypothetical protein
MGNNYQGIVKTIAWNIQTVSITYLNDFRPGLFILY